MAREIPAGVFFLLLVALLLVALVLWRSWRMSRRTMAGYCAECGRGLTAEEIEHYGGTCERCEGYLWAGQMAADDKESTASRNYGGSA